MAEQNIASLSKIVASCREQMENDLCELFEELGSALTYAVIASGHDDSNPTQSIAAALDRVIQAHWVKVAASLRNKLRARIAYPAQPGIAATDQAGLRLLSNTEESVQLAMREVLDRVTLACRDEARALEQRVHHLILRGVMQPGDSTFKVSSLWYCIEAACTEVISNTLTNNASNTSVLILLLQLIGEQMTTELPPLYRVVNEVMIEADILPLLKRGYRNTAAINAQEVAEEASMMASSIDRLVQARAKVAPAKKTSASTSAVASQALFNFLKTLQAAPPPAVPGWHTNVVRLASKSDASSQVKPLEAVTLDIVAELFDMIFKDPKVSDGIKELVARLQSTVLQAAMLHPRFFGDRSHPARRFLDNISDVAVRWGKVVNTDDPFYVKLSELIDKVQRTYDGDTLVFDSANAELEAFFAEREEIEARQCRGLAYAAHASEEHMRKLRVAQLRAQKLANACIADLLVPGVPVEIEEFLRTYWRDFVQSRISQSGEGSAATNEALQVANDLLWSILPKRQAKDRRSQVATVPVLVNRINAGFDEIGSAPTERKAFLDRLLGLQLAALRGKKHAPAKPFANKKRSMRSAGPTLQVSHATDSGFRVQDISLPGSEGFDAENTPDRANLRRVRQLVRGDWVDFITAGQARREHLTWINPSRTLFLFSNSASACAISITPEALAVRLANGTAQIVEADRPIFERAIHRAIRSLNQRI